MAETLRQTQKQRAGNYPGPLLHCGELLSFVLQNPGTEQ